MDRWMMGYPSGDVLPEIDKTEITPGKWALFNSDLTAAVGPWGISYSANLTPHETGIAKGVAVSDMADGFGCCNYFFAHRIHPSY